MWKMEDKVMQGKPVSSNAACLMVVLVLVLLCGDVVAETPFGWRVGVASWSFNPFSLFEAIEKTAALGIAYIEPFQGQRVYPDAETKFDAALTDEDIQRIRAKLDEHKVQAISMYVHDIPNDEAACRGIFDWAKKLGIRMIISEPAEDALDLIERHCNEYGIALAIHNHPEGSSRYWNPAEVLRVCEGRGPLIGACGDTGHWLRSGLDPVEAVRLLDKRLITLHLKDLEHATRDAIDRPWGQGIGNTEGVLRAVYELRLRPALFAIEYESEMENNMPRVEACAAWFQQTAAAMAAEAQREDPLFAGWASVDITPPQPVALVGQLQKRISKGVLDPLTATALALETPGPEGSSRQAVLVSCDLGMVQRPIIERLRAVLAERIPDLDANKVVLNATHTHTAPGVLDETFKGLYDVSGDEGVMSAAEYGAFFIEKVADVVAEAWQGRQPAGMSWALEDAAIGINRRARFADGRTAMYGDTRRDDFIGFEDGADPAVQILFFWGADQALTGAVVNIACPSQETESLHEISADFWHDVRQELHRRHGPDLHLLPQCGAAGDISPHPMLRKAADQIMVQRRGVSRREVIAQRIAAAFDRAYETAGADIKTALVFQHDTVTLDFPEVDPSLAPFYETDSVRPMHFHVLRLGDVAIATNPFELYQVYGLRIQARSKPILTLIVQIANGHSGYLPTTEAVAGGGYSADKFLVGPEGGDRLVNETVYRINYLWP